MHESFALPVHGRTSDAMSVLPLMQWLRLEAVRRIATSIVPAGSANMFRCYVHRVIWSFLRHAVRVPRDTPSIMEALRLAPHWPPTTILISAGTYEAPLVLAKPVTLIGEGTVVLTAPRNLSPILIDREEEPPPRLHLIQLQSSATCVCIERGAATIDRCRISSSKGHGILVRNSSRPLLVENVLAGHTRSAVVFRDRAQGVVSRSRFINNSSHGLVVCGTARPRIEHNIFREHKKAAVMVRDEAEPLVKHNRLEHNFDYGIVVCGSARPIVENNNVRCHKLPAIAFCDHSAGEINANHLEDNEGHGIILRGKTRPIVQDNEVRAHKGPGIAVQDQASALVKSNRLEGNEGVGIVVSHSAWPTVESNVLRNNKRKSVESDESSGDALGLNVAASKQKTKHGLDELSDDTLKFDGADSKVVPTQTVVWAVVSVRDEASGSICDNTLEGNDGYGILVSDAARPVVQRNVLTNHKGVAIAIRDRAQAMVTGNRIEGEGACGILVGDGSRPVLEQNFVSSQRLSAISVWEQSSGLLRGREEGTAVSICKSDS